MKLKVMLASILSAGLAAAETGALAEIARRVRTRNWNAEWTKGAAGRFEVEIRGVGDNKRTTTRELGAGEKEWHWEKAGVFKLAAGRHALALHDLTGFNGRCDALDANTNPSRSRT